jgi:hypothetical protein
MACLTFVFIRAERYGADADTPSLHSIEWKPWKDGTLEGCGGLVVGHRYEAKMGRAAAKSTVSSGWIANFGDRAILAERFESLGATWIYCLAAHVPVKSN